MQTIPGSSCVIGRRLGAGRQPAKVLLLARSKLAVAKAVLQNVVQSLGGALL